MQKLKAVFADGRVIGIASSERIAIQMGNDYGKATGLKEFSVNDYWLNVVDTKHFSKNYTNENNDNATK